MRSTALALIAGLLALGVSGCSASFPDDGPYQRAAASAAAHGSWDSTVPAWTPGWVLSYLAVDDKGGAHWMNYTFEKAEVVGNWTTDRMQVTAWPPEPGVISEWTEWFDQESRGVVQYQGEFGVTYGCPSHDVHARDGAEWSCFAGSWHIMVHQGRRGNTTSQLAGRAWDETLFHVDRTANGYTTSQDLAYSPDLHFATRMQASNDPAEYRLQRLGSCRAADGTLIPDPSACGPWPVPTPVRSTSALTP